MSSQNGDRTRADWDERRGWAYLVWQGHLARRPSGHAAHPCDACQLASMLGLTKADAARLAPSVPLPEPDELPEARVLPFRPPTERHY